MLSEHDLALDAIELLAKKKKLAEITPEPPEPPVWLNSEEAYGWECGWSAGYQAAYQEFVGL